MTCNDEGTIKGMYLFVVSRGRYKGILIFCGDSCVMGSVEASLFIKNIHM